MLLELKSEDFLSHYHRKVWLLDLENLEVYVDRYGTVSLLVLEMARFEFAFGCVNRESE